MSAVRVTGWTFALVCLAGLLAGTSAAAQSPSSSSSSPKAASQDPFATERVPYSVARIARELEATPRRKDGLRLDFHLIVVGQAPPPRFFENFDVDHGPVPFGAPTQQQFLDVVTPEAFKAPAIPLGGIVKWLVGRVHKP